MNVQAIASPSGDILWVSGAVPGAAHDMKAQWIWSVLDELEAAGLIVLADKGYQGAEHAIIPCKGRNKPQSQKDANRAHAKLRARGKGKQYGLLGFCGKKVGAGDRIKLQSIC